MKPLALLWALMLSVTASAQLLGQPASVQLRDDLQVIQRACGAPQITSGEELDTVQRAVQKLGGLLKQDQTHVTYVALVNSNDINAYAVAFDTIQSVICVPVGMVHFMGDAESELAFIIAHEIGHTIDDQYGRR
jgi:predicted Zn-dependent protease